MRQVIIDIDLDFFVTPIHRAASSDEDPRLPDSEFTVDSPEKVERFMTYGLGLDPNEPVPGAMVTHHNEVLDVWERLIHDARLVPKFSVIHVDAHDDILGYEKTTAVRSDNYLIHAVRRRWLAHICFLQPDGTHELPYAYTSSNRRTLKFDGEEVEFSLVDKSEAALSVGTPNVKPDFIFLARSPAFTPAAADELIPLISKFISPL